MLASKSKKEQEANIQEFKLAIDELLDDPKEKRVFNYLDLKRWLESKS